MKQCTGLVSFTLSKSKLSFKLEFRFLVRQKHQHDAVHGLVDMNEDINPQKVDEIELDRFIFFDMG